MQTTTNIGLKTYEANDPTDWLGEFNYNMNKIDTAVGTQNDAIEVIEETASTAVTTANTASTTANTASTTASEALQTASTKASIDDNVASATTTFSSNKINDLISGIQPGTEIDDTVTSTTKTWSSSKINTEISSANTFPDYNYSDSVAYTEEVTSGNMTLTYTTTEDCYLNVQYALATGSTGRIHTKIDNFHDFMTLPNLQYSTGTGRLFKVKANTTITVTAENVTGDTHSLWVFKMRIV